MEQLLMAMTGMLLSAGLFLLGLYLGGALAGGQAQKNRREPEKNPEEVQRERKRLLEEQEAFRLQMEYNADMAYGLGSTWEENPYEG